MSKKTLTNLIAATAIFFVVGCSSSKYEHDRLVRERFFQTVDDITQNWESYKSIVRFMLWQQDEEKKEERKQVEDFLKKHWSEMAKKQKEAMQDLKQLLVEEDKYQVKEIILAEVFKRDKFDFSREGVEKLEGSLGVDYVGWVALHWDDIVIETVAGNSSYMVSISILMFHDINGWNDRWYCSILYYPIIRK